MNHILDFTKNHKKIGDGGSFLVFKNNNDDVKIITVMNGEYIDFSEYRSIKLLSVGQIWENINTSDREITEY